MRRKAPFLVAAALIAAAVAAWLFHRHAGDSRDIRLSGNIEATEVELGFKIAGRLEKRLVDEGESVAAGQVVAILDSSDLAPEVEIKRGELAAAQASLAELEAGSRPEEIAAARAAAEKAEAFLREQTRGSRPQEIAAARARNDAARAETVRSEAAWRRAKELFGTHTISAQEFDAAKQSYDSAKARLKESEDQGRLVVEGPRREQIDQARAAANQARAALALVEKGPRAETIAQARARLRQASATLALAQTRLGYATLSSPLAGVVLSKNAEPGEYVSPGTPVVTVADLAHVWLRVYIEETDLGRVRLGQKARVTTDMAPGKQYEGRLSFLSSQAEFTPKNIQTQRERVKLVYRAKIDLDNPAQELKPGMPADAEILVAPGSE